MSDASSEATNETVLSDNESVSSFEDGVNGDVRDPKYEASSLYTEKQSSSDLEAQPLVEEKVHSQPQSLASEYDVDTHRKLLYLGGYFSLNLTLTIYNKAVLGSFAFPWLLTAIHCSTVSLGCYGLLLRGYFKLTELSNTQNLILLCFSLLFTINIAVSNVSL